MAHYIVYWPQDWVQELKKAGDQGPIKVVLGSIHSRMPTIVSVKVGDVIYPVTLIKKKLYVMARLPVTHKERAFDYCMRELGTQHSALTPEGVALEHEVRAGGSSITPGTTGKKNSDTSTVWRMYRPGSGSSP